MNLTDIEYMIFKFTNDNLLRQVKFLDIDARCSANNVLGTVHARMQHYLYYIVEDNYFCTIIESSETRTTAVDTVYLCKKTETSLIF